MFCENCGSEIPEGSKFCVKCGTPAGAADQLVATEPEPAVAPVVQPATQDAAPAVPDAQTKRLRIILAVVCVVAVIAVVSAIVAFVKHKEYEETHQATAVEISFMFAEAPSGGIFIPVNISGTDLDGKEVSQNVVATQDGFSADLLRGSYEVKVAGNPVSGDGQVYAPSEDVLPITVDETGYTLGADEGSGADQAVDVQQAFNLCVVNPADVTDEMIASIQEWMQQDEMDAAQAQALLEAVNAKVTAAREQARLEAEKQAALNANPSYVGGSSEMNLTQVAELTGTVQMERHKDMATDTFQDVYFLQLPTSVSFDGSQYGLQTHDKVILPNTFSQYAGKVVTISARYVIRATASIASASVSPVLTNGVQVVRVFE